MQSSSGIKWYLNYFICERCYARWSDEWSAMCDDRCPNCDLEMIPLSSVDLSRELEETDFEYASRRLPSPLWPPAVAQVIQASLER